MKKKDGARPERWCVIIPQTAPRPLERVLLPVILDRGLWQIEDKSPVTLTHHLLGGTKPRFDRAVDAGRAHRVGGLPCEEQRSAHRLGEVGAIAVGLRRYERITHSAIRVGTPARKNAGIEKPADILPEDIAQLAQPELDGLFRRQVGQ